MKLLYLTPTYNSYSELWQQRHIQMLSEHISYIATISPNETMWKNKIPVIDLNPEKLLKTKIFKNLKIKLNNEKIFNEKVRKLIVKVDKIFIQYLTFATRFIDIINNSGKTTFIHCHGFDVTWDLRYHENPAKKVHKQNYISDILRFKNHVYFIANSEATKNKLLEIGISENKIFLKYLGTEIRENTNNIANERAFNILYLGRLVDFKGPHLVIKTFDLASKKGLNANLIMAGDGPLRVTCELLKQQSNYSHRIFLLGQVDRYKGIELRSKADIFIAHNSKGVLTGQEEAFGVSIIEAMSVGLPVLTGRSGGVMETIIDGETGLLNKPSNIQQQADNILYLYNNRDILKRMSERARIHIAENFSFDREKQNFLKILFSH